ASSRPVDGDLSALLAGFLKKTRTRLAPDDDFTQLLAADDKTSGAAATDRVELTEDHPPAADPPSFLQPTVPSPQRGTRAEPTQTPLEPGAVLMEGEITPPWRQDLRASLPPPFAAAPREYGEPDAAFTEDEEQPRRSRRGLMIVVALVGAIGLGGGMTY